MEMQYTARSLVLGQQIIVHSSILKKERLISIGDPVNLPLIPLSIISTYLHMRITFLGSTTTDFLSAVAHREIACANQQLKYPLIPEGLFYGPRQYQPTASKKLLALNNYLKVAPHILPENRATNASVLWHADLHLQNIFVNPTEPTEILGIIDWQSVSACPLFMQVRRPAFLDYNGPPPKELGLVHLPENFDSMTPDEQQKAKALHEA